LAWFAGISTAACSVLFGTGQPATTLGWNLEFAKAVSWGQYCSLCMWPTCRTSLTRAGDSNIVYADDSNRWEIADTWAEVQAALVHKSARFAHWAKGNGLAMNPGKTQLLVSSNAGPAGGLTVQVDSNVITSGETLELLSVTYDRKMTTAPHIENMVKSARQRAALIARLGHHLPRGRYLRQLANGLVFGKVAHTLAAVAAPRLDSDTPASVKFKSIQTALNDTARTVTGSKRSDRIKLAVLNNRAGFPSFNELVTRAVAMETWKALHSSDSVNGGRNPLGAEMFDCTEYTRSSRAATAGKVQLPLRGCDTLVSNGVKIWNECQELRVAATRGGARKAAKNDSGDTDCDKLQKVQESTKYKLTEKSGCFFYFNF
jgi:hypothetical protein